MASFKIQWSKCASPEVVKGRQQVCLGTNDVTLISKWNEEVFLLKATQFDPKLDLVRKHCETIGLLILIQGKRSYFQFSTSP